MFCAGEDCGGVWSNIKSHYLLNQQRSVWKKDNVQVVPLLLKLQHGSLKGQNLPSCAWLPSDNWIRALSFLL